MNVLRHMPKRLREDAHDEGVLMNLTSGTMWLLAGAGGLVALALPGTPREHLGWLVALALVALAWGVAVMTQRFPRPGTPLNQRAIVMTVLIGVVGVALWASGGVSSFLQPILLFTALHVAYFYPARLAWPLNALFIATYASPLLYDDAAVAHGYPARVLMFSLAVAGSYAIMRLLKHRLVAAEQRQRQMAERDPLTGLANRRAFDAALARAVDEQSGKGRASLLLLDFDDFKAVNDNYGHPVGDAVLCAIADACAPEVREGDCLARLGGDEFALVAPGAGPTGAARLAASLDAAIASAPMPPQAGRVAVTIAWATMPEDAVTGEELFRVADRRLLVRKQERKGVTAAGGGGVPRTGATDGGGGMTAPVSAYSA